MSKISFLNLDKKEFIHNYELNIRCNELAKIYNVDITTISSWIKRLNLNRKYISKPYQGSADEELFQILNEESIYWMGFLMADGTIADRAGTSTIRICLSKVDLDHLIKFKEFTKSDNKITEYRNSVNFQINSKKIGDRLKIFGIIPNKSLIAKVNYLEKNKHFWRGMIDGDGTVSTTIRKNKNSNTILPTLKLVGSYDIVNEFINFCKNICPQITAKPHKIGNIYQVVFTAKIAVFIIKELYENANIYLNRKNRKAIDIIKKSKYEIK